jgi:quercetin dioxygenase-like cupin family protein
MAHQLKPFVDTFLPRGMSPAQVEEALSITHHFGGGVYAKMAVFKAGDILVQHMHNFDHLSVLARGEVELLVEGERSVLKAEDKPVVITIAAGKHHGIKALTAGVWLCVHATEETDPKAVDAALVHPDSSDDRMVMLIGEFR